MIKKKSRFLTFCFSCMPGAGHMYMGFMKQGISLMVGFFAFIALADMLSMNIMGFAAMIWWFASFFDANNKSALSDDEFYSLEDNCFFGDDSGLNKLFKGKQRLIVAGVFIFVGISALWRNIMDVIYAFIPDNYKHTVWSFGVEKMPKFIFAIIIIIIGIWLIMGKKTELDNEEMIETEDKKEEVLEIEKGDISE